MHFVGTGIPIDWKHSVYFLLCYFFGELVIYLWGSRLSTERGIVTQAFTEYGDPNSENIKSFLKSEILFTSLCASNSPEQRRKLY
jgi:hypothetical protein